MFAANLALNKATSQCNTYEDWVASRAVDGRKDTVACTVLKMHPWWSVDLGEAYDVGVVTVTNDNNAVVGNYSVITEM